MSSKCQVKRPLLSICNIVSVNILLSEWETPHHNINMYFKRFQMVATLLQFSFIVLFYAPEGRIKQWYLVLKPHFENTPLQIKVLHSY